MEVSIFRNIWEPVPLGNREIERTLEAIKEPPDTTKEAILAYRGTGDELLKKKQPVITWGGVFSNREDLRLVEPSNHVYIDVDGDADRAKLEKLPFIKAAWLSISGKGMGALVETAQMGSASYQPTFKLIAAKLEKHSITVDHSCCNISRGNFMSYDPDLYYNPDAEIVPVAMPERKVRFEKALSNHALGYLPFDQAWSVCMSRGEWFERTIGFVPGSKNLFSLRFFGSVLAMGVDMETAWEYWLSKYAYLSNDITHHFGVLKRVHQMETRKHEKL